MKKIYSTILIAYCCLWMHSTSFAQNVGIGTTTPTENLHVVGNKALFQTNFFGIGVGNPVSAYTVFQVKKNFNDFVGMYIDAGVAGKPYYGYALNGISKCFTSFDGANSQFEYHQSSDIVPDFLIHGNIRAVFNTNLVGIGTTNPQARLHVADSSVVFTATGFAPYITGRAPVTGAGRRMMWYADKAAFRAGCVGADQWDKANIGAYSFASGRDTKATNLNTTAMGEQTTASGLDCTALGFFTTASGNIATAMGDGAIASGYYSTASGYFTVASGNSSVAMGNLTTASGDYSTAIGSDVSTNNHEGALVIGDNSSSGVVMNSASNNSFRARFASGYRFYTTSDLTINALLAGGDNSWSTSSDIRLKENFEDIDGESILKKIAGFHLTSWNYKTQDPHTFRHYGPMAQDFHAAFGKDSYGTIGNDTTINQSDFLGVNFMAIQALEKRTESLITQNDAQDKIIEMLKSQNAMLIQQLDKIQSLLATKEK